MRRNEELSQDPRRDQLISILKNQPNVNRTVAGKILKIVSPNISEQDFYHECAALSSVWQIIEAHKPIRLTFTDGPSQPLSEIKDINVKTREQVNSGQYSATVNRVTIGEFLDILFQPIRDENGGHPLPGFLFTHISSCPLPRFADMEVIKYQLLPQQSWEEKPQGELGYEYPQVKKLHSITFWQAQPLQEKTVLFHGMPGLN